MNRLTAGPPIDGSRQPPSTLTICGTGNAAHALVVVASQNFRGTIHWLAGSEDKAELLRRGVSTKGLQSVGAVEASAQRLGKISADPAEVIPNVEMIMLVIPAFGHASVLRRIRPFLSDTATVGCLPTRGGFEFEAARVAPGDRAIRRHVFGLQTLPWSTRIVEPGQLVRIGAVKGQVILAALPPGNGDATADELSKMLGTDVIASDGFLNLTLGNPGQFIHPGLMYGHFSSWAGEEYDETSIPMLYAHATEEMGGIVEQLSSDAIAVARGIEAQTGGVIQLREVAPVHDWLRSAYAHATGDTSTVATCFRTGPIQARKAPMTGVGPGRFVPDFGYRYLSEDVPYGLVITRAFAELANVETPTIDAVITWAQSAMSRVYLLNGRIAGCDAEDLPIPQHFGVSNLRELIAWYGEHYPTTSAPAAPPSRS